MLEYLICMIVMSLSVLAGVWLGFWIAWRCLRQDRVWRPVPPAADLPDEVPAEDIDEDDDDFDELR